MSAESLLEGVPDSVLSDLKSRYAEPQRAYHTWEHIRAMLRWFDQIEANLKAPPSVFHAILFHDAIYDPTRSDNEAESARLFEMSRTDLADDAKRWVSAAIEATRTHTLSDPNDQDLAHFLDMDLSILGAASDTFDAYDQNIRKEYAFVPEDAFRSGRKAVLETFRSRERLYFSDWGYDKFEAQARRNLDRTIARLEQDNAPR